MSADPAHRRQLGELLVGKGVLTDAQLQVALEEQQRSGAPLGEILVGLGFIHGPTIGNALAEQHGGPLRTEYGLAIGPTPVLGMPPKQAEQSNDRGLAGDGTAVSSLRIAGPTREQDTAIARLTAALNERTQELERVKTDLADLQQQRGELTSAADLQTLESEFTKACEERARAEHALALAAEQHKAELATMKLELAQAYKERAQRDSRAQELEQELGQARARHDETADTERAQHELQLALEEHQAKLAAARGTVEMLQLELAEANEERTRHAHRTNELERQLEQVQLILEHRKIEFATARGTVETLQVELAETNEERTRHANHTNELEQQLEQVQLTLEHHKIELATARGTVETLQLELAETNEERTRHAERTPELEHQLEQVRRHQNETAGSQHTLRDLELTLEQHKAELATIKTELTQAHEERTQHANRAHELEHQLEQARTKHDEAADLQHMQLELQRGLVTAARARAQRGYGPPLRTANTHATGREEDGYRDPLQADDRGGDTEMPGASGITIKLWQLALFIAIAPVLLYTLVPVSAPLAAASIALLAAITVIHGRRTSRTGKGASRQAADRPTAEVVPTETLVSPDRAD